MTQLVLFALLAAELDGGTAAAGRFDDPIYAKCPAAPPPTQIEGGGFIFAPERAARNACLMVTCDEHRRQRDQAPALLSQASLIINAVLLVVGLVGGLYLGWEFRGLFP